MLVLGSPARAAFPSLALKPIVEKQFHSPTTITSASDGSGRLFLCDQVGKIYIIQGGMMRPTPFLNIANPANSTGNAGPGPSVTQNTGYNERGLLGLAFHPGFATSSSPGYRKFYVYYNKAYVAGVDPAPPGAGDPVTSVTVVAEYSVSATDPNLADINSERRVLMFTRPQSNHNGGQLEFGPDGYLYIGSGDGGSQQDNNSGHTGGSGSRPTNNLGNSQDRTRLLGKILRIDPLDPDGAGPLTYSIPSSNPFFNDATPGIKKEIYSFGMRNPWRFSFDKRPGGTNRLFCGDVGGDRIEEVDIIVAGGNYGWRYKEGHEFPTFSSGAATNPMPDPLLGPYIDPIAEYAHTGVTTNAPVLPQLGVSVTGGFVYRGSAIPAMQGRYVFGDYGTTAGASDGRLMGLEETSPGSGTFTLTQALSFVNSTNPVVGQRILCFGEDESGEIYIGMKTKPGVLELDGGFPSGSLYKIVPPASASLTLNPVKDGSLFEELPTNASGAGPSLFAGMTQPGSKRRALMAFDLSSVPVGAAISSAQVQLYVTFGQGTSNPMTLNRVTKTWGEGASNAGPTGGTGTSAQSDDATWSQRFFASVPATPWTTAGGDFIATASATTNVSTLGSYTWSGAQLTADVQGWVNTPLSNNGWILIGDENFTLNAKRIASREADVPTQRPKLLVSYSAAPQPTPFENWLASYFPSNLRGQWIDPDGDMDGDGIKNQIEYAWGFNPTSMESSSDFSTSIGPNFFSPDDTDLTVSFRRDTGATDLTYKLQTSSNLTTWTTIAQSTAGAATVAQNGGVIVSDSFLTGGINLVTVRQTIPAASADRKFVRLQVDRQ